VTRDPTHPRWLLACGAALACALTTALPESAEAQPKDAQRALDLGYEGDTLFARGKWAEAFERFQEADAITHSPVFVLYMARCRKNEGKLLEAAEIYARVIAEKPATNAPKPFRAAVADAGAELDELRTKIPAVRVLVKKSPEADARVTVGGRAIRAGERVLLDPGTHVFEATSGGRTAKKSVDLVEGGGETVVEIDVAPTEPGSAPTSTKGSIVPGVLLLAFGGVGLELGAVTGGLAARDASTVKEGCVDGHCLRSDADLLDRARTLATVSTVGLVVGGAAAATGIILVAVRPGGSAEPSVAVGPGFVGLRGWF
jgi:hypothetical protein